MDRSGRGEYNRRSFTFYNLLSVPFVADMVSDEGLAIISDDQLTGVDERLPQLFEDNFRLMETSLSAAVLRARKDVKLSIPETTSADDQPPVTSDPLEMAASVIASKTQGSDDDYGPGYGWENPPYDYSLMLWHEQSPVFKMFNFDKLVEHQRTNQIYYHNPLVNRKIDLNSEFMLLDMKTLRYRYTPFHHHDELDDREDGSIWVDEKAIRIADALIRGLSLPTNVTASYMDAICHSLKCMACDTSVSSRYDFKSWATVVSVMNKTSRRHVCSVLI